MRKLLLTVGMVFTMGTVNAQELTGTPTCPTPTTIDATCIKADALHPMAGTEYDYSVNVPSPTTGTTNYHWIVTKDKNFITNGNLTSDIQSAGGDYILAAGTGYNDATSTSNTVKITWKDFAVDTANPVFVVIQAINTNGCTTNNLKVYKIEPKNAFTLDIQNIETTKDTSGNYVFNGLNSSDVKTCVSEVKSAIYDSASDQIEYDYGTDYAFFAVTAANFSTSWKPIFKLTGVALGETAKVEYKRKDDATWTEATVDGTDTTKYNGTAVEAVATNGTVGTAGECILVRVTVNHQKVETLTDQTLTLAVDGETRLGTGQTAVKDIHHDDCSDDNFDNDKVNHILTARPKVDSKTATTTNPTGDNTDFVQPKP